MWDNLEQDAMVVWWRWRQPLVLILLKNFYLSHFYHQMIGSDKLIF